MNRKLSRILRLILYFMLLAAAVGCSQGKPEISIKDPLFIPSQMMIGRASSFMTIANTGSGGDTLTGCSMKEHPSVRCEMHDVVDGKMVKIEKMKVPSGKNTDLKTGSYHLMFFGIPEEMKNMVTLVLQFQKSGHVEVSTPVGMTAGHGINH